MMMMMMLHQMALSSSQRARLTLEAVRGVLLLTNPPHRYTLEAVRGVLLLSRADALACTFSSNFGRLAYEIMLARAAEQPGGGMGHPPAVSLDLPWFAFP